jgi:hypothetical protein
MLKLHIPGCNFSTKCNCYEIQTKDHVKYLGITIDRYLKWDTHITQTVTKARNIQYIFYRLRTILKRSMLLSVYQALVVSVLQYGIIGWGGAYQNQLKKVALVQKSILKIILKKDNHYSSDKTYNETLSLDPRQIFIKTILIYFGTHFQTYKKIIQPEISTMGTRSASFPHLLIPMRNTRFGQQSAAYLGPHIFNILPTFIKLSSSKKFFKDNIVNWLRLSGRTFCENLIGSTL